MQARLRAEPLITRIDYAGVYDPETLEEIEELKGDVLIAAAVFLGDIRLVDNVIVNI